MIEIAIPGRPLLQLEHLVLDLNGTLATDGAIDNRVGPAIDRVREQLDSVRIVTADTHGRAHEIAGVLGVSVEVIARDDEAAEKRELVRGIGAAHVVAVGNGANDVLMLAESAVGIAVIGREGASSEAIASADVVVCDIADALGLLTTPSRLVATLRR